MRRLMAYIDSLLLGMILGMIFLALVHAYSSHRHVTILYNRFAIGSLMDSAENRATSALKQQEVRLLSCQ